MSQWMTPEGIKTIVEAVLALAALLSMILGVLGKKEAAAQVKAAAETVKTHEATIENATKVVAGIVQGVEQARGKLKDADPELAKSFVTEIQAVTTQMGIEDLVNPIVKAVTEGQGSLSDALASKKDAA